MKRKHLIKFVLSGDKPTFEFIGGNKAFLESLMLFKDGNRGWLEVSSYVRSRTHSQNSLLHAYLQEISDETGMELQDVKDALKMKFLKVAILDQDGLEMADENGEVMMRVKDTRELNTVEMIEFIDKIKLFALEFWNMRLPEIGENTELKL